MTLKISQAQQQYIDDTFFEKDNYTLDDFARLNTSDELHYLMQNHNWDGDNRVLHWIASSPLCSEATALEMFWLAQPQDFVRYPLDKKLKSADDQANFALIKTIMTHYEQGFYAKTALHFDPTPYLAAQAVISIPLSLYEPSTGEMPYLYWEADEVAHLFGSTLKTALRHADRMDLYNIATLMNPYVLRGNIDLFLTHSQCERGIAQMLFWRIQTSFSPVALAAGDLRSFYADFICRWQAGEWAQSAIAYNPKQDPSIRLPTPTKTRKPKDAWQISKMMKKAVSP